MDILKTIREIGHFETSINLANYMKSNDVIEQIGHSFPLQDNSIVSKTDTASIWLARFYKNKYFFLTPELAIIESMIKYVPKSTEFLILKPSDMDEEVFERLNHNRPRGAHVSFINEPFPCEDFYPDNGMIVICGYIAGEHLMVLPETYRAANHYYNEFRGKICFVPFAEEAAASRYANWIELNPQMNLIVWRDNNECNGN